MFEKLIYATAGVIVIAGFGFYIHHIWSDCLDENSVFTCMRMLSK